MKIYLDNSALNRPFDDQTIPVIRLEADAVLLIFNLIDKGRITLVNSSVVEYENAQNPFPYRKVWITLFLSKAARHQTVNQKTKHAAQRIAKLTIRPIDALHLACAEQAQVDCFITCDRAIIKKYRGQIKVINPIDLVTEI